MPITLSITNAENATGTATVAGSTAGTTNNLYQSAWTGSTGTLTFALEGTRTGDGTIALAGSGLWLWRLENINGSTTTVVEVYQPITGGETESVIYRVMTTVQTQIRALSLTGISSSNIVIKWLPRAYDDTTDPVPQIIISPAPMPEKSPNDLTATDRIEYPILITLFDQQNADFTANLNRNSLWREKISREFRYQPLDGVAEIEHCVPDMKPQIETGSFDKGYYRSSMIMRFYSRETRGN